MYRIHTYDCVINTRTKTYKPCTRHFLEHWSSAIWGMLCSWMETANTRIPAPHDCSSYWLHVEHMSPNCMHAHILSTCTCSLARCQRRHKRMKTTIIHIRLSLIYHVCAWCVHIWGFKFSVNSSERQKKMIKSSYKNGSHNWVLFSVCTLIVGKFNSREGKSN